MRALEVRDGPRVPGWDVRLVCTRGSRAGLVVRRRPGRYLKNQQPEQEPRVRRVRLEVFEIVAAKLIVVMDLTAAALCDLPRVVRVKVRVR